jgi:hypothetical protein
MILIGRSPFPVRLLRWAHPLTDLDFDVIERSHRLGCRFHGIVQLGGFVPTHEVQRTDWSIFTPPWRQRRRA